MLVTQHCLLSEAHHQALFICLDDLPEKSLERLQENFSPLGAALVRFKENISLRDEACIKSLFAEPAPRSVPRSVPPPPPEPPVSSRPMPETRSDTSFGGVDTSMWFNILLVASAVVVACLLIAAMVMMAPKTAMLTGGLLLVGMGMFACHQLSATPDAPEPGVTP